MKKILMLLTAAVLIYSCSNSSDEAKRKALQKYKQKQHELTQKINALEKELEGTQTVEIVDVKVTELNKQEFEHFIEVNGNVEAVNNVDVSPESAGIIEDIYVKEGQRVQKGDVLATLRNDVLQRSIDQLKVQLDLATTNYERQKNLWEQNIGSEMQFLQAKTNMESLLKQIDALKAQLELAEVTSPIDGIIDIIYQKKGQIGGPQSPFARVINNDEIKIYGDVSENYLTKVKSGANVKVFFPAINKEVETPIRQIGNVIDNNNRTFRIRLNITNPTGLIKPNLVAIIKIRDYYDGNQVWFN